MDPLDRLLQLLFGARTWPIPREHRIRGLIARWIAFRETQEEVLRRLADWPRDRLYVPDPLPANIAQTFGDLLFGEDPEIAAAAAGDQGRLDAIVEPWPTDLRAAEETTVSEGESWWRISNPGIGIPIVTWHSRFDVVPLLHGRQVLAAAFVSRLEGDGQTVYRHVEAHGPGRVVNLLFRGRMNALGGRLDLSRHPETQDLVDEWKHGLPMLCGRVVNRYGRDPRVGVSIYDGIWRQFLVLNEATTIGRENMRLTAKKRAVVPASAVKAPPAETLAAALAGGAGAAGVDTGDGTFQPLRAAARFDAGEDVLVHDPLDVDEGRDGKGPFQILEYSFDADQLIAFKRDTVETIAQRCDLVSQFLGSGDFGQGNTGTALRVRLLPTVNAAEGRGRPWDDELPVVGQRCQQVAALPVVDGGLGQSWSNPQGAPAVKRTTALPEDPVDQAHRHAELKQAALLSAETSIRERYPDWSDQQVSDEIDRIRADSAATMPTSLFGGPAPPPGGPGGN